MTLQPADWASDPVPKTCVVLGHQVLVSLSGGMNPASPRVLRATLPLGRMVSHVMLPLFKPIRNQPSGGNCRALREEQKDEYLSIRATEPLQST